MLANRRDEVWSCATESLEQLFEVNGGIHEVGSLLAQHLDEGVGVEVEQIAEELVRRLRLHAVWQRDEVLGSP